MDEDYLTFEEKIDIIEKKLEEGKTLETDDIKWALNKLVDTRRLLLKTIDMLQLERKINKNGKSG